MSNDFEIKVAEILKGRILPTEDDEVIIAELQALLAADRAADKKEAFDKGVEEGYTSRAIIEVQARDRFIKELRVEQEKSRVADKARIDGLEKVLNITRPYLVDSLDQADNVSAVIRINKDIERLDAALEGR